MSAATSKDILGLQPMDCPADPDCKYLAFLSYVLCLWSCAEHGVHEYDPDECALRLSIRRNNTWRRELTQSILGQSPGYKGAGQQERRDMFSALYAALPRDVR